MNKKEIQKAMIDGRKFYHVLNGEKYFFDGFKFMFQRNKVTNTILNWTACEQWEEAKEWYQLCSFPVVCRVSNKLRSYDDTTPSYDDTVAIITAYHEGYDNPFESQYDTFWENATPLESDYFYQLQKEIK